RTRRRRKRRDEGGDPAGAKDRPVSVLWRRTIRYPTRKADDVLRGAGRARRRVPPAHRRGDAARRGGRPAGDLTPGTRRYNGDRAFADQSDLGWGVPSARGEP